MTSQRFFPSFRESTLPSCRTLIGRSRPETTSVRLLTQSPPDPECDVKVKDICDVYLSAQAHSMVGERTLSLDEMTGIQALERAAPDLPMRPGKSRRREFEYIRHGTQTLIASLDVASGRVIHASVGATRTQADYLAHVQHTVGTDLKATKWHLMMDGLKTHQAESLVHHIAPVEGLEVDRGLKGKSGLLHSMATRTAFLTNPTHRLVFHFTPKQCAWLNQMEI